MAMLIATHQHSTGVVNCAAVRRSRSRLHAVRTDRAHVQAAARIQPSKATFFTHLLKPAGRSAACGGRSGLSARSASTQSTVEEGSGQKAEGSVSFDWLEHWYPVIWEADLPPGKPTKVTLFEEEYCLLRRPPNVEGGSTMCLRNACPHRMAALSEGRMTAQGLLQCAYHGWSFDATGACVDLPTSAGGAISSRACSEALPCEVAGGHVWVFPGALHGRTPSGPPPVLPEMEAGSGWSFTPFVRDFPIDYSVLVENITDPDHGLFAHQSAGFDFYTASEKYPQTVEVLADGEAFSVESRVTSANKLTARVATAKEELPRACVDKGEDGSETAKVSTTRFDAPCTISMGRKSRSGKATFLACFWVIPTGFGRSRFMSCALVKSPPFRVPRWAVAIGVNNFLDQDTHLLGTAQARYLPWELERANHGQPLDRRALFRYQSPSENLLIAIGRFMDRALPSMPLRYSTRAVNSAMGAGLAGGPRREQILDRWAQHTALCPDSQGAVAKAGVALTAACALFVVSIFALGLRAVQAAAASQHASLSPLGAVTAAISNAPGWAVLAVVAALAAKLRAEFFFKYTETLRDRDLRKISNVYPDTAIASAAKP